MVGVAVNGLTLAAHFLFLPAKKSPLAVVSFEGSEALLLSWPSASKSKSILGGGLGIVLGEAKSGVQLSDIGLLEQLSFSCLRLCVGGEVSKSGDSFVAEAGGDSRAIPRTGVSEPIWSPLNGAHL